MDRLNALASRAIFVMIYLLVYAVYSPAAGGQKVEVEYVQTLLQFLNILEWHVVPVKQ